MERIVSLLSRHAALLLVVLPLHVFSTDIVFPYAEVMDYPGCTDPTACNFDPGATVDDGSCIYGPCELVAVPDDICVQEGEVVDYNVLSNDIFDPIISFNIQVLGDDPCFFIEQSGQILTNPDATEDCCGEHILFYQLCSDDGLICSEAQVTITVKCGKPDCTLINIEDYVNLDDGGVGNDDPTCASVCEFSESTIFIAYDTGSTYNWTVVGGTYVLGGNPAEIIVTWGATGSGTIFLTIVDGNGVGRAVELCIDILPGPTANFTTTGYVCLGQQMCFNSSSSTNADDFFWDFGDGNSSTMPNPCHLYTSPGNYNVILTAIKYNYDELGNPLCCCTDTLGMDVVVDSLPGPGIFWVSTVCEGDSICYWTDATNCTNYTWTVEDANGSSFSFTGQGNDTIYVTWPMGPTGTISLLATGCDDVYCNNPTTVTVPIIPSVSQIDGPVVVCENSTHTYTLPKWLSTLYEWSVTGGTVLAGDSTHSATIMWGPAGVGTIHVDYHSEFLNGLPNHEGTDCYGVADLTVDIRPEFELDNPGPSLVCVDMVSTVSATSLPSPNYTWTITPAHPFTGQGTDNISITWNAPGLYIIQAIPDDLSVYCNNMETIVISVKDIIPPTGILGPTSICPLETTYYTATTSESGVGFIWSAINGTPLSSFGETIGVAWGPTGPYSVSVSQYMLSAPGCISDPITLVVNPKLIIGPLSITGGANCTNTLQTYNLGPAQHPDAQYLWCVTPDSLGSVVSGQGTPNIDVQWNNDPGPMTLTAKVILCGDTTTVDLPGTLVSPIVPVITQIGNLCPGVPATLDAGPGFTSYLWSTTDITQTSVINFGGIYSVSTVDGNGCPATSYFEANEIDGPPAIISSGDNPIICIPSPHTVTIVAQTNPNLTFEWFCDGVSQGPASTTSSFVHPFVGGVPTSFSYTVKVTDITTLCFSISDPLIVQESDCDGGPPCQAEGYSASITATPQPIACSTVDFSATTSNFTITGWDFGDGNTSGLAAPSHTYSTAGCYYVVLTGLVPEVGTAGFCERTTDISVCVPIASDFDFAYLGCDSVSFTQNATFIVGPGNAITSYLWNFGFTTSTAPNPTIIFPGPGTYPVTLTVTNSNGCIVTSLIQNVMIGSVGTPVISVSPTPVCAPDPSSFTAPAAGAVTWFWDFDDGATFTGPNPSHGYTNGGVYNVQVTVQDNQGCEASAVLPITVFPGIPPGVITAVPGLTICQGSTTMLTAPAGYSYLWTDLSTTQSINVGAGTYGVTLTDGDGCTRVLDPVTVVELPLPDATITGNPFICDDGCVTLSAPFAPGSTYQWYDAGFTAIPFETSPQILVCDYNNVGPYTVEVIDQNGCRNVSAPFGVTVAISPSFDINVVPDSCAGTPSTMTIVPVQPNVVYTWNNGDTGTISITSQAGIYTAIGTDTLTGCWSSASQEIYPLPDLCAVPAGCYEVCNPDTICGPPGLTYQWNMNGSPLLGETNQCLIVSADGSYNLTATNIYGCIADSDSLYLEVINCDSVPCDSLSVDFSYLLNEVQETDSCCFTLEYTNNYGDLIGLSIGTNDADLSVDLSSIDPALQVQSITANQLELGSITIGGPIPTGTVTNVVDICLVNVLNNPQTVVIDWIDMDDMVICSDTLEFYCPAEPDCLYLQSDSIYCEDGLTIYEFTVCNPNDAPYDIGYINLNPTSPGGIVLTPPDFDISGSPITPGTCQTFNIQLSGPGIAGQMFCYELLAHDFDPELVDSALCCSLDTTYCILIPPCDPCADIGVEGVASVNDEDCCYDISLYNNWDPNFFDEIGICVISPNTSMTINNPFGSGWTTSSFTSTSANLIPGTVFGNFVPGGVFTLPEICLETYTAPNQQIEIKWMQNGEVLCRDTLEVGCKPPCGYLFEEHIDCSSDGSGNWVFTSSLYNNADYTVSQAQLTFTDPALSAYDQLIPLGSLTPNSVFSPFTFVIGAPALAGDTICFTITLHEVSPDGLFLSCCNFNHCIVLPPCDPVDCLCDDNFIAAVNAGFTCVSSGNNPNLFTFQMVNSTYFSSNCDELLWQFGDGTPNQASLGGDPVFHTFPSSGAYLVCVKVIRFGPGGILCKHKFCKVVYVGIPPEPMTVFPNPNEGIFYMELKGAGIEGEVKVTIHDELNRPIFSQQFDSWVDQDIVQFDLSDQAKGVYIVSFEMTGQRFVKRVIIH